MSARKVRGRFLNEIDGRGPVPGWRVLLWLLSRRRTKPPPYQFSPTTYLGHTFRPDDIRITFIGHCTLLVELAGRRILTDPVFGPLASPFSFAGPRRYHPPGIPLEGMPPIDLVVVSHNHYDHLEEATIRHLGDGPQYVVPLGLGDWFRARGCTKVVELDWWEEFDAGGGLIVTATPCQHWSKRKAWDQDQSLWCGFAFRHGDVKFLFIGDSGYYEGFAEIGRRLGPFHVVALPIGAYEPRHIMEHVHMTPEQAVQAFEDVGGSILLPTHYGCFPLTDEDPTEPPRRLYRAWRAANHDIDHLWLLAPGQFRSLEHMIYIPTVRPVGKRIVRDGTPRPRDRRDLIREWGIVVCPQKGDMVDVEAAGAREEVFEGDGGNTLVLNHLACSGFGSVDACRTGQCPLRDPTFLRGYELHGTRAGDDAMEVFAEVDSPPNPRWWQEQLQVILKED